MVETDTHRENRYLLKSHKRGRNRFALKSRKHYENYKSLKSHKHDENRHQKYAFSSPMH